MLEDRFQGLVEGSLASAFAKRRGEDVRQLVAMMVSIGRSGTVEKLYNAARLAPLQVLRVRDDRNLFNVSTVANLPGGCPQDAALVCSQSRQNKRSRARYR